MAYRVAAYLIVFLVSITTAHAEPFKDLFPSKSYQNESVQQFVESLDYQQGRIKLAETGVELQVARNFYYLSPMDARRVIVEVWRNPPSLADNVLGMIFPIAQTPADDTWGAVISYDAHGYISDADAAGIDYSDLLRSMQEATLQANELRVKEGYPKLTLVGWASPPFYDRSTHKLHWAKELEFHGQSEHTLNYFVRALGRHGVLNINFVAGMDQLPQIRTVIPAVLAMPEFTSGLRYSDYVPSTDKVAAYGIGGLIAGGVAQKLGLFALALAFLKKGWILVLIAFGGAWRFVARWFGRDKPQA